MSIKSKFWRVYSALSVGFSTGVSIGWSVIQQTASVPAGLVIGGIGLIGDAINWNSMQGPVIDAALSSPQEYKHLQGEQKPEGQCARLDPEWRPTVSRSTQFLYTLSDGFKSLCDRYFLMEAIFILFCWNPTSPFFWAYLSSTSIVKELLNLAAETYEANEDIAQSIGNAEDKPFYADFLFKRFSSRAIKALRVIGSADHTLHDDLAALVATVPPEAIAALRANPGYGAIPAALLIVLGYLIYRQTNFFEGEHAARNINKSTGRKPEIPAELSPTEIKILQSGLKMMGPLHGSTLAVPPYLSALRLMEKMGIPASARYPIALIIGGIVGVGAGVGTQYSEVHEAQEQLREALEAQEAKNLPLLQV